MMFKLTDKDWEEDSPHENGMYQNKCHICGSTFIGHKHRPHCKVCHDKCTKNYSELTEDQKKSIIDTMKRDIIGHTYKE